MEVVLFSPVIVGSGTTGIILISPLGSCSTGKVDVVSVSQSSQCSGLTGTNISGSMAPGTMPGDTGPDDEPEPGAANIGVVSGNRLPLSIGTGTAGVGPAGSVGSWLLLGVSTTVIGSTGSGVSSWMSGDAGKTGLGFAGGGGRALAVELGSDMTGDAGVEVADGRGATLLIVLGSDATGDSGVEIVGGSERALVVGLGSDMTGGTGVDVAADSGTALVVGSEVSPGVSGSSGKRHSSDLHGSIACGGSSRPNEPPSFRPHPYQYGLPSSVNDLTESL